MTRVEPGETLSFAGIPEGSEATLTSFLYGTSKVADGGPAPQGVGSYAASWVDAAGRNRTSTVEVVGWHYFGLDEMRDADYDGCCTDATDSELASARQTATEVFERACRRSFTARRARAIVSANMNGFAELPWSDVDSAEARTMDGTAVECDLVGDCQAYVGARKCLVTASYGMHETPDEVRRACIEYALYLMRPDSRPSNAVGQSTDFGFVRFSLAGRDGATGLVEVDAVIKAWSRSGVTVL